MTDLPHQPPFDSLPQIPRTSPYDATDTQPYDRFGPRPSTPCDAPPSSSTTSVDFAQRIASPNTFMRQRQQEKDLAAEVTTQEELSSQAGHSWSPSPSGGVTLHGAADVIAATPVHFHGPLGRIAEVVHQSPTRTGVGKTSTAENDAQGLFTTTYPTNIIHDLHQQFEPQAFRNQDTHSYPHDVFQSPTYPHALASGSHSSTPTLRPRSPPIHDFRPQHDVFHAPPYPPISAARSQSYFPTIHPSTRSGFNDWFGSQTLLPLPALGFGIWNDHRHTATAPSSYDQIEPFRMQPNVSQLQTDSYSNTSSPTAHDLAQGYHRIRPEDSVREVRVHYSPFPAMSLQSDRPLGPPNSREVDAITQSSSSSSDELFPPQLLGASEPPMDPNDLRDLGENGDPGDFVAEAFIQAEQSMRVIGESVDTLDRLVTERFNADTEGYAQGQQAARDARRYILHAQGNYTEAFDETRVVWNRILNDTRNIRRVARALPQVWEGVNRVRELEATLQRRERRIEHLEWEVAFLRKGGE